MATTKKDLRRRARCRPGCRNIWAGVDAYVDVRGVGGCTGSQGTASYYACRRRLRLERCTGGEEGIESRDREGAAAHGRNIIHSVDRRGGERGIRRALLEETFRFLAFTFPSPTRSFFNLLL